MPFWVVPDGDMFQKKIDELFTGIVNVFGIADNILIAEFNDLRKGHDKTLHKVSGIC